ncbi:unnamed protein product, partial [Prorocentrum cordatum]
MAPGARRDQQGTHWCCKWCTGRNWKPFVNVPDKLGCHARGIAKPTACMCKFERPSVDLAIRAQRKLANPAIRAQRKPGSGTAPVEQQLQTMHEQVEQLQRELKDARAKTLAADAEARIAVLEGHIEHLGKTEPMPEAAGELAAQHKNETGLE